MGRGSCEVEAGKLRSGSREPPSAAYPRTGEKTLAEVLLALVWGGGDEEGGDSNSTPICVPFEMKLPIGTSALVRVGKSEEEGKAEVEAEGGEEGRKRKRKEEGIPGSLSPRIFLERMVNLGWGESEHEES